MDCNVDWLARVTRAWAHPLPDGIRTVENSSTDTSAKKNPKLDVAIGSNDTACGRNSKGVAGIFVNDGDVGKVTHKTEWRPGGQQIDGQVGAINSKTKNTVLS